MSDAYTDPNTWAENLDPNKVQIWREALAHLRHLSDEVWKGFKFFMAGNAVIFAWLMFSNLHAGAIILVIIFLLGIGFTVVGHYILKRNRVYYLQMLLKKTLLEKELGFYEVRFSETNSDLAFPWRLNPEAIGELKEKPDEWVRRQVRGPGTIARWLFIALEIWIVLYATLLIILTLNLLGR